MKILDIGVSYQVEIALLGSFKASKFKYLQMFSIVLAVIICTDGVPHAPKWHFMVSTFGWNRKFVYNPHVRRNWFIPLPYTADTHAKIHLFTILFGDGFRLVQNIFGECVIHTITRNDAFILWILLKKKTWHHFSKISRLRPFWIMPGLAMITQG